MATVLVLGQLCDPSSELHWAGSSTNQRAADLLSVPAEKVKRTACTGRWMRCCRHKPALEKHLKERLESCFETGLRSAAV